MGAPEQLQPQSFALLCGENLARDSGDKSLERAFKSLAVKRHLEAIKAADDAQFVFLPGAGAVYMRGCKYALVEDRWMALFVGEIENYSYLVKKYCLVEAGLDPAGSYLLETVRALSPLNDAQVVALLFKKLGPTFMSKVRGSFAFAVYDAHIGRVLACNDVTASNSLWQGHIDADNCLVVACNLELPSVEVAERTTIGAGEYKFGWRAAPIVYMASQAAVKTRCNEAMQAAMAALASASGPLPSMQSAPAPASNSARGMDRRKSRTMPRSSLGDAAPWAPSASTSSAGSSCTWHTNAVPFSPSTSQPGSYVPPHRRSQGLPSASGSGHHRQPHTTPGSPGVGKRGLEPRNSQSSMSGSWRRSTSDAMYRPPKKLPDQRSSITVATLWRPSPSSQPPPQAANKAGLLAESAAQQGGGRERGTAAASQGGARARQGSEGEQAGATVPSSTGTTPVEVHPALAKAHTIAASSLLFQPAKVEGARENPPMHAMSHAIWQLPQDEPSSPSSSSLDGDFIDCPSLRSNPIPIRPSRDSRPSVDITAPRTDAPPAADDVPCLIEKKDIQSSLESLMSSSNSSIAGVRQPADPMQRPSSMLFPWSEAGSSFGGGMAHHQVVDAAMPTSVCSADLDLAELPSPGMRDPLTAYISTPTSKDCAEVKELLDQAAKSCQKAATLAAAATEHASASAPEADGMATPKAFSMAQGCAQVGEESGEGSGPDSSLGQAAAPAPTPAQAAPGMTSSGSFSDALALLLRSRSPQSNSARHSTHSPTAASQRSQLSMAQSQLAPAASPSREDSQVLGMAEDSGEGVQPMETAAAPVAVPVPTRRPQTAPFDTGRLSPVQEQLAATMNAGVAWQFGDRIIPSCLLNELAGGKDSDLQEQSALASLLYSSPCSICIVDVQAAGQPVVYVNALFERQTGYTADEVLGQNLRFLQAPPSVERKRSVASVAMHRAISMGRWYSGKVLNFSRDGKPLWNQLSLVPVRTKSLAVTHYIGMQNFTVADVLSSQSARQASAFARRSSHQCLTKLGGDDDGQQVPGRGNGLHRRSASYQVLSSLNPELVSMTSAAVHGCLGVDQALRA